MPESPEKVTRYNDIAWESRALDPAFSRKYSQKAMALAQKLKDDSGLSEGMVIYGHGYLHEGALDSAEVWFQKGLELREANDDKVGVASCFNNLGLVAYQRGENVQAIEWWKLAYQHTLSENTAPFRSLRADICRHQGLVYKDIGKYDLAYLKLQESLTLYEELESPWGIADLHLNLGALMELQGTYFQAMDQYKTAFQISEINEYPMGQSNALINIGGLYLRTGELYTAEVLITRGMEARSDFNPDANLAMGYINLGLIQSDKKNYDQALYQLDRADSVLKDAPNANLEITLYNDYGYVHMLKGDFESAQQDFQLALNRIETTGNNTQKPEVLSNLTRITSVLDQNVSSLAYANLLEIEIDSMRAQNGNFNALLLYGLEKRLNLEKAKEQQRIITISALIVICLILFLLGALFRSYRSRKKEQIADQRATIAEINEQVNRQRLEEQLRKQELDGLNLRLEIEQTERKRIAQELHDDLGGTLSYIILKLKSAEEQFDQRLNEYADAMGQLNGAVEKVRNISHKMEAGMPGDFEVTQAIRAQVESVANSGQITMEFHSHGFEGRPKLSPKMEKALFRIFQECLSNIIRHSKTEFASFQLIRDDQFVHFLVEDEGVGFSMQEPGFVPGIGLKGIEERVAKLNGTLEIDSRPGKGTTLSIDIPIT